MNVNRAARRGLGACAALALAVLAHPWAAARTYEVGPGKRFTSIGSVPWGRLGPGDVVRIGWRKEPYREKFLVSGRGTAQQPIRVSGVPGPNGELPVIDGKGATTGRAIAYLYEGTQDRGLLTIAPPGGARDGYKPAYILIENLDLRNAAPPHGFRDPAGKPRSYARHAAALFVERGEHIAVRNCVLSGSGNGLFVSSGGGEIGQSRDVLVEGCEIAGNGNPGSDREHNVYTEAIGIVFQHNRFGPPRAGAGGNNLKDRSAGTVVRYNWFEDGAHLLDLVEPDLSSELTCKAPGFRDTFVYGNVMTSGPGPQMYFVHYGGDGGSTENYRKGTLHFYHNTVAVRADQTGPQGRWRTVLLRLQTDEESADVRNNIIYVAPATPGAPPTEVSLLGPAGRGSFGVNWVSPGWLPTPSGVSPTARLKGTDRLVVGAGNDPGFVDLGRLDFHLAERSACRDLAGPLDAKAAASYPVRSQLVPPRGVGPRAVLGKKPDLGAFEGLGPEPDLKARAAAPGTPAAGAVAAPKAKARAVGGPKP